MNNTPPEVIKKWRAEFEEAYSLINGEKTIRKNPSSYWDEKTQRSWSWFLFARQSVRIELPQDLIWEGIDADECMDVSDIKASIESQGYKVNN